MTGVKISTLPWADTALDTDQIEVNQGGTSRRVTVGQVASTIALSAAPAQPYTVYATDFGARFDGVANDTAALQAFLDAIPEHGMGVMPPGTALFTSTLTVGGDDKSLIGAGAHTTVLKYAGAATGIDLIHIVDPVNWENAVRRWSLRDFRITSDTTMTAGAALHLHNAINSILFGVIIDGHEGSVRGGDTTKSKLWNGAWFDCAATVHVYSMIARAFNDCVIVNGGLDGTNGAKADIVFDNGRILQGKVGLRIAGAYGGLCTTNIAFQHNDINCRIDTTITAEVNREIFFGTNTMFDTCWDTNIYIADTFSSASAIVQFADPWIAGNQTGGTGNGIYVAAGVGYSILIDGGRIWLNRNSGIKNDSLTATIMVSGTQIMNNGTGVAGTWGFENIAGNTTCSVRDCMFISNGSTGTNSFSNIVSSSEFGSSNEFRVRERIRAIGAGQATNSIDTAGNLGGCVLVQDNTGAASSGAAVVFGSAQGFFSSVRGQMASSTGNTTGHVVVSTRNTTADATLREVARFANTGAVTFLNIGTTASAANCFIDNAANNSVLRVTSSARYKTDWEDLDPAIADRIVEQARPGWYRSLASADNPEWSWYGLTAEQMAEVDPRLVHWTKGEDGLVPDGVMYERLTVMLLDVVRRQGERLAALENK